MGLHGSYTNRFLGGEREGARGSDGVVRGVLCRKQEEWSVGSVGRVRNGGGGIGD